MEDADLAEVVRLVDDGGDRGPEARGRGAQGFAPIGMARRRAPARSNARLYKALLMLAAGFAACQAVAGTVSRGCRHGVKRLPAGRCGVASLAGKPETRGRLPAAVAAAWMPHAEAVSQALRAQPGRWPQAGLRGLPRMGRLTTPTGRSRRPTLGCLGVCTAKPMHAAPTGAAAPRSGRVSRVLRVSVPPSAPGDRRTVRGRRIVVVRPGGPGGAAALPLGVEDLLELLGEAGSHPGTPGGRSVVVAPAGSGGFGGRKLVGPVVGWFRRHRREAGPDGRRLRPARREAGAPARGWCRPSPCSPRGRQGPRSRAGARARPRGPRALPRAG